MSRQSTTSAVYESYWPFATGRQRIFDQRVTGLHRRGLMTQGSLIGRQLFVVVTPETG
jgi:hypothetical protein